MPDDPTGLFTFLKSRFEKINRDYNEIDRLARKMEERARLQRQRGPVVTGLQSMVLNRYHGLRTIRDLPEKAGEGAAWAYYFAMSPRLKQDVNGAIFAWVKGITIAPTWEGLWKAGITSTFGTRRRHLDRVGNAAAENMRLQSQALGVSFVASMSISSLLKQVGKRSSNEYIRITAMRTRTVWQVTGVVGLMYGFSRIADTMQETGEFGKQLRTQRDTFNATQTMQIRSAAERFSEAYARFSDPGF